MIRKPLTEYGFPRTQLEEIYKFLKYQYETSQSPNESLDGIRYFIDKSNIFYVSYCLTKHFTEGTETHLKYLAISPYGTNELNKLYDNPNDLIKRFEKYSQIEIV
jgi:predicted dithiol-disulfide oxidoreductase (DUF899 family)